MVSYHELWILKSKNLSLHSKLFGCGICGIRDLFFKFFGKYEKKKTELTLSLILQFNLRLGGYSIWSATTSRTIYDQDFGLQHLTASEHLEVLEILLEVFEGRPGSNQDDVLTT